MPKLSSTKFAANADRAGIILNESTKPVLEAVRARALRTGRSFTTAICSLLKLGLEAEKNGWVCEKVAEFRVRKTDDTIAKQE